MLDKMFREKEFVENIQKKTEGKCQRWIARDGFLKASLTFLLIGRGHLIACRAVVKGGHCCDGDTAPACLGASAIAAFNHAVGKVQSSGLRQEGPVWTRLQCLERCVMC